MSMITEQTRMLRDVAQAYSHNGLNKILNEAADTIEALSEKVRVQNRCCAGGERMDIQKAIKWMKDMQAYCKDVFRPVDRETADYIVAALKELGQYREAGTPEECREAREKQAPKRPVKNDMMQNICPECSDRVLMYYDYCTHCGQAIDWSGIYDEAKNNLHESNPRQV